MPSAEDNDRAAKAQEAFVAAQPKLEDQKPEQPKSKLQVALEAEIDREKNLHRRRLTDSVTEIPVIGRIQRATDEQWSDLVAGKVVTFTQEQLLAVLKWVNEDRPIQVTKTAPGIYEVVSIKRFAEPLSDLFITPADDDNSETEKQRDERYSVEAEGDDTEPSEKRS